MKLKIIFLFNLAFSAFAIASNHLKPIHRSRRALTQNITVVAAWFAGWHEKDFKPTDVPWKKYTNVIYAFANTAQSPIELNEAGLTGLPDFVEQARKNNVTPMVSIGGWGGSRFFSTAVGSDTNRAAFVKTVTNLAVKYKVDGIDFDWEYPNSLGIGCNVKDTKDTENFLLFLQELRRDDVGKSLTLTAAVGIAPWLGNEGAPLNNVSEFAKVFDYVAIMNYDVYGSSSRTVGPNAPLDDACAPSERQAGSATQAVNSWTKAGMPANKLVLGVPGYGHSFRVRKKDAFVAGSSTQLALYPAFDAKDQPAGDKWDAPAGTTDVCGTTSTAPGGTIAYRGMIDLGYLDTNGNAVQGRPYLFDNCSKTAFSYDPNNEIMVSYDDPQAMRAKGQFIKEHSLRGFSVWEAGGDYNSLLLDAIRNEAVGYDANTNPMKCKYQRRRRSL